MTNKDLLGQVVHKALTTKMSCTSCHRSFTNLKGLELECGECETCGNTWNATRAKSKLKRIG